jgi:hypothetical protein
MQPLCPDGVTEAEIVPGRPSSAASAKHHPSLEKYIYCFLLLLSKNAKWNGMENKTRRPRK